MITKAQCVSDDKVEGYMLAVDDLFEHVDSEIESNSPFPKFVREAMKKRAARR